MTYEEKLTNTHYLVKVDVDGKNTTVKRSFYRNY